ncbi:Rieske (2Fe-2S) protein [Neobacillus mesonae]|uniref:Rieske (2Fe-2S) protein n=1 Tax=Neobacillus mesonae TaxID=1193713 RepID=UPI00203E7718|nr:Rieske (2Fe-2S) protein [Neobacillus mesonae]MCM3569027.1 Rieske (2Fe-2S) protein [Neobacillus mesonae]
METMQASNSVSVVVCAAENLQPGQRKIAVVDGVEIAILNVDGELYAFRNRCPHQGVEMIYGTVSGTMLPSDPGEYIYGCDNQIVSCPLHGWEFDMKTGKSLFSSKVSVGNYEIQEIDGSIVLKVKREPKSVSLKNFRCSH